MRLTVGRYDLAVWGASGGGVFSHGSQLPGGTAANVNQTILLDAAYSVNLVIGGQGGPAFITSSRSGGGGGGGSFAFTQSGVLLLAAGGGGGE